MAASRSGGDKDEGWKVGNEGVEDQGGEQEKEILLIKRILAIMKREALEEKEKESEDSKKRQPRTEDKVADRIEQIMYDEESEEEDQQEKKRGEEAEEKGKAKKGKAGAVCGLEEKKRNSPNDIRFYYKNKKATENGGEEEEQTPASVQLNKKGEKEVAMEEEKIDFKRQEVRDHQEEKQKGVKRGRKEDSEEEEEEINKERKRKIERNMARRDEDNQTRKRRERKIGEEHSYAKGAEAQTMEVQKEEVSNNKDDNKANNKKERGKEEDKDRCQKCKRNVKSKAVLCEKCNMWIHFNCLGIKEEDLKGDYVCFECEEKGSRGKINISVKEDSPPEAKEAKDMNQVEQENERIKKENKELRDKLWNCRDTLLEKEKYMKTLEERCSELGEENKTLLYHNEKLERELMKKGLFEKKEKDKEPAQEKNTNDTRTKDRNAKENIQSQRDTPRDDNGRQGNRYREDEDTQEDRRDRNDQDLEEEDVEEEETSKRCYACGSREHIIKDCNKEQNLFIRYKAARKLQVRDLVKVFGKYGKIRSKRIKKNSEGEFTNIAMICFDTERQAKKAINEMRENNEWEVSRFRANRINQTSKDKDTKKAGSQKRRGFPHKEEEDKDKNAGMGARNKSQEQDMNEMKENIRDLTDAVQRMMRAFEGSD